MHMRHQDRQLAFALFPELLIGSGMISVMYWYPKNHIIFSHMFFTPPLGAHVSVCRLGVYMILCW